MIPKIEFVYSWIYDDSYRKRKKISKYLKKMGKSYPSSEKIKKYIKKVEKMWLKVEKSIVTEMSRVSGLKWKENKIKCYIIGFGKPFSDPLTVPVYSKYPDLFIDVLTHELIHQLFIQKGNYKITDKSWEYIYKKYKKESFTTKIHIPLHAVHTHIYLKYFNEKRLKRDFELIKHLPAYKRSWEIVEKEGYKNIIKQFKDRLK